MQDKEHNNIAVLIYMLLLVVLVISNMLKEVDILDIIYLVALICCILKYFMIMHEDRK